MPNSQTSDALPDQAAMVLAAMRASDSSESATPSIATKPLKSSGSTEGSKTRLFLPSLYQMCNDDDDTHRQCISWSEDGKTFWVSNTEKFSRLILPMYFRHNNYASFVRQLNMYGFQRSTESKGKVTPGMPMVEHFTHKFFQRGREDLLGNIHRKTSSFAKQSGPRTSPGSVQDGASVVPPKTAEQLMSDLKEAESSREQMQNEIDELREQVSSFESRLESMERENGDQPNGKRRRKDALPNDSVTEDISLIKCLVSQLQSEVRRLSTVKERVDELHTLFHKSPGCPLGTNAVAQAACNGTSASLVSAVNAIRDAAALLPPSTPISASSETCGGANAM